MIFQNCDYKDYWLEKLTKTVLAGESALDTAGRSTEISKSWWYWRPQITKEVSWLLFQSEIQKETSWRTVKTCNFALIQCWSAANSSRVNTNGLISRRLVGVRAFSTVVKDLTLTWVWAFLNIKEDVKRQTSQNFALWTISKVAAHVLTMQILDLSPILTNSDCS